MKERKKRKNYNRLQVQNLKRARKGRNVAGHVSKIDVDGKLNQDISPKFQMRKEIKQVLNEKFEAKKKENKSQ